MIQKTEKEETDQNEQLTEKEERMIQKKRYVPC